MTEWGVVSVIITLVGFIAVIIPPILKLNGTIVSLRDSVNHLDASLKDLIHTNTKDHRRIWDNMEEQEKMLHNHETRIEVVEWKLKHQDESVKEA